MKFKNAASILLIGFLSSFLLIGCSQPVNSDIGMDLDSDYEHEEVDLDPSLTISDIEVEGINEAAPIVDVSEMSHQEFIDFVGSEACKSQRLTGIPASVTIAQAILETGWGKYTISDAKNLFGIKGEGPAGSIEVMTRECIGNDCSEVPASFRKYNSFEESITDHSQFLLENQLYATALQYENDPDEFARQIHKAGYATDPNYANLLISIMSSNNLYRFDCPSN